MEFRLQGICEVLLEHAEHDDTSTVSHCETHLGFSGVAGETFMSAGGGLNKQGVKALTQCFVQGLIGNIHKSHQENMWDSAEHLRYIISELERGFVAVVDISEGDNS